MDAEALALVAGHGMVTLLDLEMFETGPALLLERIEPGLPLTTIEDDTQAISIAASVMRRIWRPVPDGHHFPTIARWALGLEKYRARYGSSGPIPARLFDRSVALYTELGATMSDEVLLHGDLHQDNILAATREPWLAIDPKALVGEPAYETGSLLRNTRQQLLGVPDAKPLLARRIAQLADELELDRERIRGWGEAQAVLSACWTLEGDGDAGRAAFPIGCAEALAGIRV
jgi:streptomycin 6-kinase